MKVQANNRRNPQKKNNLIMFNGKMRNKKDLCNEYGISEAVFSYRTKIKGMRVEDALSAPLITQGRPRKSRINI